MSYAFNSNLHWSQPERHSLIAVPGLQPILLLLAASLAMMLGGCGKATFRSTLPNPNSPPSSAAPTASQSGSVAISPRYVALAPGQKFQFTATAPVGAQLQWSVNGVTAGNPVVGTVDATGNYAAPPFILQSKDIVVKVALASSPQQNYATAVVSIIQSGQVTCPPASGNPQVALYSIYLPAAGKAWVEFGKTTSYGLTTWQVPTSSANGGQVQIEVAGMVGNTDYHMRAHAVLDNGATFTDADQVCTTGAPPATPPIQISTTGITSPMPGIEIWNTVVPPHVSQAFATDLEGHVIWSYSYLGSSLDVIQGLQLLPDGNLLMLISYLSSATLPANISVIDEIREVDLAGNTIRSISMDSLNKKMAASHLTDAQGNIYTFKNFHHSVLALPNGHWVLLVTMTKNYTNLPGYTGETTVIGDAVVDVDQNSNPDWVWNTFDHLDINRHPMNFPDWTHSNGLLYSSDDHNLLLSIRHQNWVIKINYLDGMGSGDVMWRLGEGGNFKLAGGVDPTDWFYAQHGFSYFSPNTTGVFRLGLMDNGNDRIFPSGQVFCKPGEPISATCYSTAPVLEVNESNMTATLIKHYEPPPSYFSFFGGNVELLPDDHIHVDFAAPASGAIVQELDSSASQLVWQGVTPNADQFHAYRWPSLYPGVQW